MIVVVIGEIKIVVNGHFIIDRNMGCFGFYAQDPDGGEILYAITPVKQGTGDWFPADNGVNASSIEVGLSIQVGNSANVTMQVDAGAYATVTMLNAVKADVQAIKDLVGLADKGVVGLEVDWTNRTYKRMRGGSQGAKRWYRLR